jgi:hypothetical protein
VRHVRSAGSRTDREADANATCAQPRRAGSVSAAPARAVWVAEKAEVLAATPPAEWHCAKCGLPWNGTDWWLEACPNLVQVREGWFDVESVAHWLVRRIAFNWANRDRAQMRAGARQMIDQQRDPRVKKLFSKIAETIFADIDAGLDGPLGWCATIDGLNKLETGFEEEWS